MGLTLDLCCIIWGQIMNNQIYHWQIPFKLVNQARWRLLILCADGIPVAAAANPQLPE